jgi:hypothetical protein
MSKYSIKELWNEIYGTREEACDYVGRLMFKSACGNPYSAYQPTIDHIRPIDDGGKDKKQNIVICHYMTNEEKADSFPHWKVNGVRCHAKKTKGEQDGYTIIKERNS